MSPCIPIPTDNPDHIDVYVWCDMTGIPGPSPTIRSLEAIFSWTFLKAYIRLGRSFSLDNLPTNKITGSFKSKKECLILTELLKTISSVITGLGIIFILEYLILLYFDIALATPFETATCLFAIG